MNWTVKFFDEFEPEFNRLPQEVKDEMLAEASFIEIFVWRQAGLMWTSCTAPATRT